MAAANGARERVQLVQLDFSDEQAAELEIDVPGKTYVFSVVQANSSWGLNSIPTAEVLVAVGRVMNGPEAGALATIHSAAKDLRRLLRARLYNKLSGRWNAGGKAWPAARQLVFEGFFDGMGPSQSSDGKIAVPLFLSHWLKLLTFSSCIAGDALPGNPWQLSAAALARVADSAQSTDFAGLTTAFAFSELLLAYVDVDLWQGVKEMLTHIAQESVSSVNAIAGCAAAASDGSLPNGAALEALARIEGPAGKGGLPYEFAAPITFTGTPMAIVREAITQTIGQMTVQSFAATTMWDKLVGEILPLFHLGLVPMVDRALVVPICPTLTGKAALWRTIPKEDYEGVQADRRFDFPLRGVGVYSRTVPQAGALSEQAIDDPYLLGGCYVAPSIHPGEGVYEFIPPPPWLVNYDTAEPHNGAVQTFQNGQPLPSGTGVDKPPDPVTPQTDVHEVYARYAKAYYAMKTLAQSGGVHAGKLRFDIAPGSLVRIQERTLTNTPRADDALAGDLYAHVARVTWHMSAEGPSAGTTLLLTHVRTAADYADERYGVSEHPLFDATSIHGGGRHGAPLHTAFKDYE